MFLDIKCLDICTGKYDKTEEEIIFSIDSFVFCRKNENHTGLDRHEGE